MVYFTHSRLMRESETSVHDCAESGFDSVSRICSDLITNGRRYATWVSFHDRRMLDVTHAKRREPQIVALRLVAIQQVHRAALVRHCRDNQVTGRDRDLLLAEFRGPLDADCAVLAEHRVYTQAVSSQLCASELLELSQDRYGVQMLEQYERQYGTFFAMHCDRLRAVAAGRSYLLSSLMPEVRGGVERLRRRLVAGDRLPARQVALPETGRRSPVADQPFNGDTRVAR